MADAANRKSTLQYKHIISLNREKFMENVVFEDRLTKKELRVFLHLLTVLDSTSFKKINAKKIAKNLGIKKSEVEVALVVLMDLNKIDKGDELSVKNGYKLLF